jgi:hypothetical protein
VAEITMLTAEAMISLRGQLKEMRAEISRMKRARVRIEWQ